MSAPFMQFYVADYLGDTRHLTTEQHGAYLLLLFTMWRSDGRLSNDPRKLARVTGCTVSRWSKISADVMAFFEVQGDEIVNRRLTLELEKAQEKSIKRAQAGTRGGNAKALKTHKAPVAIASGLLCHSSEPEPEVAKATLSEPKGSSVSTADAEAAFGEWNSMARRLGLPLAKDFTPERRKHLRARLALSGLDGWREALRGVAASKHCRGENERGWRADFDFVCQPKSFQRLREGFYGVDADNPSGGVDWGALVDNWRATGRWASSLGPPPDHPETQVPQQLRAA